MVENTKENVIKVLKKIIECDKKLIKSLRNEDAIEISLHDVERLEDVVRMINDQDFFDSYYRLFVEGED